MAYEQRSYSGNAPPTALSAGITASALSITVVDGTGYPTGSDGPFFIVIDPATALEEKVLVATRSTNTFTIASVSDRGADSTTQQSHGAGAVVQHVHTATDAFEANQSVVHGIARIEAKGDLVAGTETRATGRVMIGTTNNDALVIDAAQATGMRWGKAAPADHNHSPAQGANIPVSSVIGLQSTLDTQAVDMAAHAADTDSHGATGAIVGTTNTQTLTNKTFIDPVVAYSGRSVARKLVGTSAQRVAFTTAVNGDTWYETDLNREYIRRGGAWLLTYPMPYFKVYRQAAISLAGGIWNGMDWDTVDKDNWGVFHNASNRFFCPVDGYYQFNANTHIGTTAGATMIATGLFWYDQAGNGPSLWAQTNGAVHPGLNVGFSAPVNAGAWFNAGSSIYSAIYHNFSGYQGFYQYAFATWFEGHLVQAGPAS